MEYIMPHQKPSTWMIHTLFVTSQSSTPRQAWAGTHYSLAEAEAAYLAASQNPNILAAALCEWAPGVSLKEVPRVAHHDYATRNCAGGMPRMTVLKHGDRGAMVSTTTAPAHYKVTEVAPWQDYPGEGHTINVGSGADIKLGYREYTIKGTCHVRRKSDGVVVSTHADADAQQAARNLDGGNWYHPNYEVVGAGSEYVLVERK
jgi:hypothetical protein